MKRLGAYILLKPLGSGAFGQTYLARHELLGTLACLKWARHEWAKPGLAEEARILWELHHASLAGLRDFWVDPKLGPILAMRYVEGPSLAEQGPRDAHHVLVVLGRLLRALRVLHHSGIVHNDIKPTNIILERGDCNPVLVDFGVASNRPSAGPASGFTPLYVAPEVAAGQTPSPQSDLYSLGLTLLEWIGADLVQRRLPAAPPPLLQVLLDLSRRRPELRRDPLEQVSLWLEQKTPA